MELTLVRHLTTPWNRKQRLQGQQDISIVEDAAIAYASTIDENKRKLLQSEPYDIVLASALKRAQQTAWIYGYGEPVIEPWLNELDFGSFEGRPKPELVARFGERWYVNPRNLVLGESFLDLERRVLAVLENYKAYEHILIFGHGSWIRALLSIAYYGDVRAMNRLKVDNNEWVACQMEGERDESTIHI